MRTLNTSRQQNLAFTPVAQMFDRFSEKLTS